MKHVEDQATVSVEAENKDMVKIMCTEFQLIN